MGLRQTTLTLQVGLDAPGSFAHNEASTNTGNNDDSACWADRGKKETKSSNTGRYHHGKHAMSERSRVLYDPSELNQSDDSRAFSVRYLLLLIGATCLVVMPVAASSHLALGDALAHEARLTVLREYFAGASSPFYDVTTFFIPNIAFDAIGLGLVQFVDPETAGRIFVAATLALTLWGMVVLNRAAIGRWSATPLAGILLLFHLSLILGFLNYVFGLALVFWALAGRLALEHSAPARARFAFGAIASAALLFCHLASFGIYTTMTWGFGLAALIRQRRLSLRSVLFCLEALPAVITFLFMHGERGHQIRYIQPFVASKLAGLAKSFTCASLAGDFALIAGLIGLVALLVIARPRMQLAMLPGLIALALFSVLLPQDLGAAGYIDVRFPPVVALLGLTALDLRPRDSKLFTLMVTTVIVAIIVKQVSLTVMWRSFDDLENAWFAKLTSLPAPAVILEAECQPDSTDGLRRLYRSRQPPVAHLTARATFDGTRFDANNFAEAGQQPIAVRQPYRQYYELARTIRTACITDEQTGRTLLERIHDVSEKDKLSLPVYLIMIEQKNDPFAAMTSQMSPVMKASNFALYRILSTDPLPDSNSHQAGQVDLSH